MLRNITQLHKVFGGVLSSARSNYTSTAKTEKCMNQVTLLGRVGVDPQLRGTEEHPVTVFTLATNSHYKLPSTGEMQHRAEWHRISIFKPFLRDSVYRFMKKGQRVMVQGRLQYGQIKDVKGIVHTTTTIVADDVIFFSSGEVDTDEMRAAEDVSHSH